MINRGYLTILRWYAPEEGTNEEADKFYQPQEIMNKIDKKITFY